jgi:rSAM/selenodomain-associated transferase 2
MLSIVIPTLDAAAELDRTLAALDHAMRFPHEIIVADGGSADTTEAVAAVHGARFLRAGRGRGRQLAAGAKAARGDWLLFLHADTRLSEDWAHDAAYFMADDANRERAAAFRLVLDDDNPKARRIERLAAWRARRLGLAYGDQGLLISRAFYDDLGGYRPIPLMEDVALVRRIGRRRLVLLDTPAVTSAARYRTGGYWARPARNLVCLVLYFLGLPPRLIARLYA